MGANLSFVVVHGPPMTGKTLNADAMRRLLLCSAVLDDYNLRREDLDGLSGRVLILATEPDVRDPRDRRRRLKGRRYSVEMMRGMLGDKWQTKAPEVRS